MIQIYLLLGDVDDVVSSITRCGVKLFDNTGHTSPATISDNDCTLITFQREHVYQINNPNVSYSLLILLLVMEYFYPGNQKIFIDEYKDV